MDYDSIGFVKASKYRWEIIRLLASQLLTPTEISSELDIHKSQVSRYLSELADHGLVKTMTPNLRKGRMYALTDKGKKCLKAIGQ